MTSKDKCIDMGSIVMTVKKTLSGAGHVSAACAYSKDFSAQMIGSAGRALQFSKVTVSEGMIVIVNSDEKAHEDKQDQQGALERCPGDRFAKKKLLTS